ncbi:MAG: hypothetical protein IIB17_11055, partial [Chloroflexi bacterium]|nr:hypothetical protein [Chloroflexota bacterium]
MCLHDIHPGNRFCNGVFDLQTGISFNKEKGVFAIGSIGIDEKLKGADVRIVDILGEALRGIDYICSELFRQMWRGRNLHDLLVSTLDAALSLAEMHNRAVLITKNLDFDLSRTFNELLDLQIAISTGAG